MAGKGTLVVRVISDTDDLTRGLKKGEDSLGRFGRKADDVSDKLVNTGKKMTLVATVPIVAGLAAATNAASNLEQSMGAVESIFGTARGTIDDFANGAAEAAGLSKREVNEMAAVLGASLQGMGFEAGASAEKVVELQKRGADMAATFGGTTKDALDAIASLMRGERDPIEKYGVSIKQVDVNARIMAMGLDTSTAASKKNAEAVAGLDLLMEQTAKTQGQFARESDSTAGAQQRAKAAIENSAASLGESLLPLAADAADVVADLAGKFGDLPDPIKKGVLALGGMVALAGPLTTAAGAGLKFVDFLKRVPPAATVAGAAAVGLGIFLAGLAAHIASVNSEWEKTKETWNSAAQAIAEGGSLTSDVVQKFSADFLESKGVLDDLADAGLMMADVLGNMGDATHKTWDEWDRYADALVENGKITPEVRAKLGELREALNQGQGAASDMDKVLGGLTGTTEDAGGAAEDYKGSLEDAQKALADLNDETIDAESSTQDLVDAVKDAGKAHENAEKDVESARDAVGDAQKQVEDYTEALEDAKRALDEAMRPASADDMESVALGVERALVRQGDAMDAVNDAQRELDRLRKQAGTPEEIARAEDALAKARWDARDAARGVADAEERLADARAALATAQAGATPEELAAAQEKVTAALRSQRNSSEKLGDANKALAEAQTALSEAQSEGDPDEIAKAQDRLTQAQRSQRDATEALGDATKSVNEAQKAQAELQKPNAEKIAEAEERIADAVLALRKARVAERESIQDQAKAQAELDRLRSPANAEAIAEAERELADAVRAQRDSVLDLREAQQRQQEVARQGTDLDQRVIDARDRVTEAEERVREAQDRQREAAGKLQEAQTNLSTSTDVLRWNQALLLNDLDKLVRKFPELGYQAYLYRYELGLIANEIRNMPAIPVGGNWVSPSPGGSPVVRRPYGGSVDAMSPTVVNDANGNEVLVSPLGGQVVSHEDAKRALRAGGGGAYQVIIDMRGATVLDQRTVDLLVRKMEPALRRQLTNVVRNGSTVTGG